MDPLIHGTFSMYRPLALPKGMGWWDDVTSEDKRRGAPTRKHPGTPPPVTRMDMRVAEIWSPGQPLRVEDLARFVSKIQLLENSCHQWLGKLDSGYGRFWCKGRTLLAHRVAWEHLNGPVPTGLQIDHLCRNRGCVNPDHLEPVTLGTNVLRGIGITATNFRKTHCVHGHVLDGVYVDKRGSRHCRPCAISRTAEWRKARAR